MPLPRVIHDLIERSIPELPVLNPDQFDQVEAYLRAPDRITFSLSQLQQEKMRGETALVEKLGAEEEYLRFLRRVIAYNLARMDREHSSKGPKKKGRPRDTDLEQDRRLFELWQSGVDRTYLEFAGKVGKSLDEVIRAIDRHRKRLRIRSLE